MRIVAGKYRRRKLLSNPGLKTRPITDRVKETLFERLHSVLEGSRVADVFAGTGTLGFEALSREARSVVFIEQDRRAFELLRKNISALHVDDDTFCWRVDALRTSFRPKGIDRFLPYDLVFFDPPYRMIADLKPGSPMFKSLERLARREVTAPEALLVLRTPEGAQLTLPNQWRQTRLLELGTMSLHLNIKQDIS